MALRAALTAPLLLRVRHRATIASPLNALHMKASDSCKIQVPIFVMSHTLKIKSSFDFMVYHHSTRSIYSVSRLLSLSKTSSI